MPPVTPAERACATVLRAYLAWSISEEDVGPTVQVMVDLGVSLRCEGLLFDPETASPAGAALLARVEAAERTLETVLRAMVHAYQDAAVEAEAEVFRAGGTPLAIAERRMLEAQDAAANMRATAATYAADGFLLPWLALRTDYAARLAGTTPIDAPPAKEPT